MNGGRANSGVTAAASATEVVAGRSSIGGNLKFYENFNGNQYVATVRVATIARTLGQATFVGGFALDAAQVYNGDLSGGKFATNTAVGAYGLIVGVAAAPAVVMYFGAEAFFPGGALGAMEYYGEINQRMQRIDPLWNKR